MGLRTAIRSSFLLQCGVDFRRQNDNNNNLLSADITVCEHTIQYECRQILTSKFYPRAVRVKPLSATIVVFKQFYQPMKLLLAFSNQYLQMFGLKLNKFE